MDLVTIGLDLLLAVLLVAALAYGVRLERRLKTLRDGQLAFVQSVRDLDAAVLRAETGLDQLRLAGEEARDGLHDRILKAREAKAELERLVARAERQAAAEPPARIERAAPAAEPETPRARSTPPRRAADPAPAAPPERAAERVVSAILSLGDFDRLSEPLRGPIREPLLAREPLLEPAPERPSSRRPRGLDEDLFDLPAPAASARRGGRR